jgi:hypothetical protein
MANSSTTVERLVATKRWSVGTATAFVRAEHRCEYCRFDFLASVEALKQMEVDHIVPLSSGGEPADLQNIAIACRHCNFHLKRKWDPRSVAGESATREELLAAVIDHIGRLREPRLLWLHEVRGIVGYVERVA